MLEPSKFKAAVICRKECFITFEKDDVDNDVLPDDLMRLKVVIIVVILDKTERACLSSTVTVTFWTNHNSIYIKVDQ